jgi:hypothetical protein
MPSNHEKASMSYDNIKMLAKVTKRSVTELIALAPQNDPFYVGTPRDKTLGVWFHDLWKTFGYTEGVHIRRMHYAIVSQNPPVKFPNGKPYENTLECWAELTIAAKAARYLNYVSPVAFVDRRNEAPVDFSGWDRENQAENAEIHRIFDAPGEISMPTLFSPPHYDELKDFHSIQRYHLEIWCEKSTMNDILKGLVIKHHGTLLFGKGELSITAANQAIARFREIGKPVRIFYVSDFDPAGVCMPVSMSRKLEYFVRKYGEDLDIKLFPVVLTYQQTKEYPRLLGAPVKESEKRKAGFDAKYGDKSAIELDALEALYPGELKRILEREMSRYTDDTLYSRVTAFHREHAAKLSEIQKSVYAEHADDMQSVEDESAKLEDEWQAIIGPFTEKLNAHIGRRVEVWQAIRDDLEENQPEVSEDDLPEAVEADEREGALYDSSRDYLAQNDVYQAYKAGPAKVS